MSRGRQSNYVDFSRDYIGNATNPGNNQSGPPQYNQLNREWESNRSHAPPARRETLFLRPDDDTYADPFLSQSSQKRKAFEHHLQSNTITKRSRFDDRTPLSNTTSQYQSKAYREEFDQSNNNKKRKKPDDAVASDGVGGMKPWQPPSLPPPPRFNSFMPKFPPTTTSMDNNSINNPKRFRSDINSGNLQPPSNFNETTGLLQSPGIGKNTGNGQECPTTLNSNQDNNSATLRKSRFGPEVNRQHFHNQSERFGQISDHAGQFNKNIGNITKAVMNSSEFEQFCVNNRNTGTNIEAFNTSMFRNDQHHRIITGSNKNQEVHNEFIKDSGNLENSYKQRDSSTLRNDGTQGNVELERSTGNFPNSLTNAEFGKSSRNFWQSNEYNICETNAKHYPNTSNSNNRNFRENTGNFLGTNDQSSGNQFGNYTTKSNDNTRSFPYGLNQSNYDTSSERSLSTKIKGNHNNTGNFQYGHNQNSNTSYDNKNSTKNSGNPNNTGNFPYDHNQNNYDISCGRNYSTKSKGNYNNTGNFPYGHNQNSNTGYDNNYTTKNNGNTENFSYGLNQNNNDSNSENYTLGNLTQFQGNKQFPSNFERNFQQTTGNFQNNSNRYQGYKAVNCTPQNVSHFQQNTGFGNKNKGNCRNSEFRRVNVGNFTNNNSYDFNAVNYSSNDFSQFASNALENNGNRNNSGNKQCFQPQNESTSTEIMSRFGRNSTGVCNKPQLYKNNSTLENVQFERNTGNFSNSNNANTKPLTPAQFQEHNGSSENHANTGFRKNTGNFSNLNNAELKPQTAVQFQQNKGSSENPANTGFQRNTGNLTQLSYAAQIEMTDGNAECFQMPNDGCIGNINNVGNFTKLPPTEDDGKNIQFGMKRRMGGSKDSYTQRHEMDQLFMKKSQQTNTNSFTTMHNQQQFVPLQRVLNINPAPPVEDLTKPPPPLNANNATMNNGSNSSNFQNVGHQSGGPRFRNNQTHRGNRAGPKHFGARQVNNRQFGARPFRGNNNGQKRQFTPAGNNARQRNAITIVRKPVKFPKAKLNRYQFNVKQDQPPPAMSSTFNNNIKKRPTFGAINAKRYGGKQPNKYAMLLRKVKSKFAKRPKNPAAKERKKKMRKLRKLTQKQRERLLQGKPEHLEHIDVNKQVFGEFLPINVGGGALKKPAKGHLKPEPETYWQQWWSLYGYVEKSLTPIDSNDESVNAALHFMLSPTDKEFRKRKRLLLVMGVSKIMRHIHLNENDYAMRDIFNVLKYKHQLEDPQFQQHLNAKEAERVEKVLKQARKKTRRALFCQSMICRWHFSSLILKRADNGEPLKCGHARKLMSDKTFNFLVGEAIKELKTLITEDWPKFEDFHLSLQ